MVDREESIRNNGIRDTSPRRHNKLTDRSGREMNTNSMVDTVLRGMTMATKQAVILGNVENHMRIGHPSLQYQTHIPTLNGGGNHQQIPTILIIREEVAAAGGTLILTTRDTLFHIHRRLITVATIIPRLHHLGMIIRHPDTLIVHGHARITITASRDTEANRNGIMVLHEAIRSSCRTTKAIATAKRENTLPILSDKSKKESELKSVSAGFATHRATEAGIQIPLLEAASEVMGHLSGLPSGCAPPPVSSKSEYLRELDAQIQYKRNQTEQEQHNLRLQDEKKDREIAAYNPWGRAGGGAPPAKAGASQPPDAYAGLQHQMPMQPQSQPSYNAAAGVGMAGYTPASTGAVLFAGQQPPLPPIADFGDEHKFQRGQRKDMPSWERDELQKRQKLQQDHQDSLRRQMAEREATKAAAIAAQKAEDKREADRLQREHDALQEKYAREAAEEREKAEAARVEAAKKKAEMEKEQERRDQAFREQAQKGGEKSRKKRAEAAADTAQTAQPAPRPYSPPIPTHRNSVANNPPPFRSNSPPIPTHANKSAEQHHQALASDLRNRQPHDEHQQQPFRSSSPPIPAVRAKLEREASEHAIGPPPPQPQDREPSHHVVQRTIHPDDDAMPDTRAVLQQLIAIQQELAREDAAIQSELHSRHADEEKEAPPASAQGQANKQEAAARRRASTPRKQPPNVTAAEPDGSRHAHDRHASSLPLLSTPPPPPTIALARRSSIPNTLRLPRAKTPSLISNQRAYIAEQESSLAHLRNSERMIAAAPHVPPTAIHRPSAQVAAPIRPESAERARRQELINDFLAGHAAGAADDGDPAHRGLESESTLMYLNGATPKPPAPTLIRPTPIKKRTPPLPSPRPPSLPTSPSPTPSLDIASLTALNDRRLRTLTALKAAPTSATSAANRALLDDFLRKHVVPVSKRFPETAAAEGHPIPAATSIYTPVIH
ncbi:hypothetical protein HDU87_007742 [Geranomyces variabilis]|uniref:Uncharacterized protein n=1 Tax=Geranomyces variabilis TaxID=109894 RepID=A0AAD5TE27_9FUNG|nr:hypothetical protein HDU87_007742 [Geranomyces variabilis]